MKNRIRGQRVRPRPLAARDGRRACRDLSIARWLNRKVNSSATQATETFQPSLSGQVSHHASSVTKFTSSSARFLGYSSTIARILHVGSPESGRYCSPSNLVYRSISLRRQTFPTKEIRIGLRRMLTRIHKAVSSHQHQIPLNELTRFFSKPCEAVLSPAACRNAFRQPRGQHAPAGSVHAPW